MPEPHHAYADPDDAGNGPEFHSGKRCIVPGCDRPAGTRWSPLWCFKHNVERMDRINRGLAKIGQRFAASGQRQGGHDA
jgi:hypothetical protein